MGPSNAAQGLCKYYIGSPMHNFVRLKGAVVCWHGAAQEVVSHFGNINIQMFTNGASVHWAIN
jgi:hypothetical protein